jgi:hypothetical protein
MAAGIALEVGVEDVSWIDPASQMGDPAAHLWKVRAMLAGAGWRSLSSAWRQLSGAPSCNWASRFKDAFAVACQFRSGFLVERLESEVEAHLGGNRYRREPAGCVRACVFAFDRKLTLKSGERLLAGD